MALSKALLRDLALWRAGILRIDRIEELVEIGWTEFRRDEVLDVESERLRKLRRRRRKKPAKKKKKPAARTLLNRLKL